MSDWYDHSLLGRLEAHAAESPERVAFTLLREHGDPERLTFGQLVARVRCVAARLGERFRPGERAILAYPHGLEFVATFLGCLAAGLIAVPAYPPRRNRKAERLDGIIADCTPAVLLTADAVRPTLPIHVPSMATDGWPTTDALAWDRSTITPHAVAFLQYTSGSTGTPRGVVVTHANLAQNEQQLQESCKTDPRSVNVSWLPLFHDMGLVFGALHGVYVGFPTVLLAPSLFAQQPARWMQAVSDFAATHTAGPNFAFDLSARVVSEEQRAALRLSSLRRAINGAEPVRAETFDRFLATFSRCGLNPRALMAGYGMAETTLVVSGSRYDHSPTRLWVDAAELEDGRVEPVDPGPVARCLVGCGPPGVGVEMRVVDPEARTLAPAGRVGELWVQSGSVAAGYWGRPEDTHAAFVNRLADTGEGPYLATGDLGFIHAGEVYVTGRRKDLIIVRGRNIYPQDVEAAVASAGGIEPNGCAAFADPGPNGGEGIGIVAEAGRGLVRLARTALAEVAAVAARVRAAVAEEFEVVPHRVVLVRPGSFPRTSSGKVQRRACRDAMRANTLDVVYDSAADRPGNRDVGVGLVASVAAARSELLQAVRRAVVEAFTAEEPAVGGVADDTLLHALAPDSIRAAAAAARVEEATGVRLEPDAMYHFPTVGRLATHVVGRLADSPGGTEPPAEFTVAAVTTRPDLEAVGRLRYAVTVEEMGLTMRHADHQRRVVDEPLDRCGCVFAARHRGEVVATLRVNLLRRSDVGYYFDAYGLGLFAEELRPALAISTRLAVARPYRNSGLLVALARQAHHYLADERVAFNVMDCRKPLLPNFLRLGYRVHLPDLAHPEFGDVTVLALDLRAAGAPQPPPEDLL
jgi:acyl-CoA synthetase (AMP-forming)/AMP-acid ligase II/acyl carrier protein